MNSAVCNELIDEGYVMPMHISPLITNTRINKLEDPNDGSGEGTGKKNVLHTPHLCAMDNDIRTNMDMGCNRIILACRDLSTVRRASRYYMMQCVKYHKAMNFYGFNEDDFPEGIPAIDEDCDDDELEDLYDEATRGSSNVFEVSFETITDIPADKSVDNVYLKAVLSDMVSGATYLFTGFEDGKDIDKKVQAIRAIAGMEKLKEKTGKENDTIFMWIRPEQIHEPWVLDLEMSEGFRILNVDSPTDDYYADMVLRMLARTGTRLEDGVSADDVVMTVRHKLGGLFDEQSLDWMFRRAIELARDRGVAGGMLELKMTDFIPDYDPEQSALNRLESMIGLKNLKRMISEAAALKKEQIRNPKLKCIIMHNSMIFFGDPGTGKTTAAKIYADCMAEGGYSNGVFVYAAREDIIGKYVGHTSPKIAAKFKEARGGVLFVDEAGFFLNKDSGGYVGEALKEFVRYMESMPDVTVIFGLYEREVEGFLALDEGLRSRISQMIRFDSYTNDELYSIAQKMCEDFGYSLDPKCRQYIIKYADELRQNDDFGNARDIRRLVENSIRAHSVALYDDTSLAAGASIRPDIISMSDIKSGIERSRNEASENKARRRIGFDVSEYKLSEAV